MVFNPDNPKEHEEFKDKLKFDANISTSKSFFVSKMMKVLQTKEKKIDYIVLKIGNEIYSTRYADIKSGKINGKLQRVNTIGIGKQDQLWVKDNFIEGSQHKPLEKPINFELNVYFSEEQDG